MFRVFISALVVFLLIYLPCVHLKKSDEASLMYNTFIGNRSEYQGIIEIWNIDTFESGTASKVSYLEKCAKKFQNKNKGLHFMIRNITENECLNMLNSGQSPDLFSCSYGVSSKIQDYLAAYNCKNIDIFQNCKNAGMVGGELVAIPWCLGFYSLITTKSKLEKSGVALDGLKLLDIVFSSDYVYKQNKKEKISYSVTFGSNKYLMPKNAILSYNKSSEKQNENSIDKNAGAQSQYSAYCRFLTNDATILLGTQRDIARFENKVSQGKVSDVIYQPLMKYTDLVQFMMISNSSDEIRKKYAEEFVLFLLEDAQQQALENIGMFAVKHLKTTGYCGVMKDIVLENNGDCKLFNVFDELEELG